MKDLPSVKAAILAQQPRFAIVAHSAGPIPVEATLDEVIAEIKARLVKGLQFHAPVRVAAGQNFGGMQLVITQPPSPAAPNGKDELTIQIYTDLADPVAQTDQNFIAYAIQGLAVSEFMDEAIAARAAKAAEAKPEVASGDVDNVTDFPKQT